MDNRTEAKRLYLDENMTMADISARLGLPKTTVRSWKTRDQWDSSSSSDGAPASPRETPTRPGCRPPFQPRNKISTVHGLFSKYLPEETRDIVQQIENSHPLDLLWDQILLSYASVIRAQRLMHVLNQGDHFESKVGYTDGARSNSERFEVQTAWDRHAGFMKAQSTAQITMAKLMERYEDACNAGLATEEQQARIAKLRASIDIEERRYALDQRKAGMGDDIESESGIAYLPGVDPTLLEGALPDPEGM
jgi:uncharacterized protein YjcR